MALRKSLTMSDNNYMRTLSTNQDTSSADEFGVLMEPETYVTSVPRGRSDGLFGALAGAVCRIDSVKALPLTAVDELGSGPCMFEYDPSEAIALDSALG